MADAIQKHITVGQTTWVYTCSFGQRRRYLSALKDNPLAAEQDELAYAFLNERLAGIVSGDDIVPVPETAIDDLDYSDVITLQTAILDGLEDANQGNAQSGSAGKPDSSSEATQ